MSNDPLRRARTHRPLAPRSRLLGAVLASSAIATLGLGACGTSQGGNATGTSGGAASSGPSNATLTVAYGQTLASIDPAQSNQNNANTIDDLAYDTLATYNSANQLVGTLATAFSLTPDATAIDVTLRSGVKFHDGTALTATDVAYSFDRYVAVGSGIGGLLGDYASTEVTDPTHLVIRLKKADALFIGVLSKIYILEKSLVAAHAGSDQGQSWLQTHDAGSGPYVVTVGTNPVTMTRFPDYWAYVASRPAKVILEQIAQSPTEASELKTGQINVALDLQTADADSLSGVSGVSVSWLPSPNTAYIYMNTKIGVTANPTVRRALQLAYDYSGGLKVIRGGHGQIENGPLPQTLPCLTTAPPFAQNLIRAKSLLYSAHLSSLSLTLRFQPSIADQVREATLLQSDLRSIGVTLNLVPITFPEFLAALSNPSTIPEMVLVQDTAPFPDPGVFLYDYYDSATIGTTNRSAYSNPTVDQLLGKAQVTSDIAERCSLYQQAQTQINADAPAIDLYTLSAPVGYASGVSGLNPSATVYPISLRTVRLSSS